MVKAYWQQMADTLPRGIPTPTSTLLATNYSLLGRRSSYFSLDTIHLVKGSQRLWNQTNRLTIKYSQTQ
jgi:hypothetical protein